MAQLHRGKKRKAKRVQVYKATPKIKVVGEQTLLVERAYLINQRSGRRIYVETTIRDAKTKEIISKKKHNSVMPYGITIPEPNPGPRPPKHSIHSSRKGLKAGCKTKVVERKQ